MRAQRSREAHPIALAEAPALSCCSPKTQLCQEGSSSAVQWGSGCARGAGKLESQRLGMSLPRCLCCDPRSPALSAAVISSPLAHPKYFPSPLLPQLPTLVNLAAGFLPCSDGPGSGLGPVRWR